MLTIVLSRLSNEESASAKLVLESLSSSLDVAVSAYSTASEMRSLNINVATFVASLLSLIDCLVFLS
jgi:hypothetical protein